MRGIERHRSPVPLFKRRFCPDVNTLMVPVKLHTPPPPRYVQYIPSLLSHHQARLPAPSALQPRRHQKAIFRQRFIRCLKSFFLPAWLGTLSGHAHANTAPVPHHSPSSITAPPPPNHHSLRHPTPHRGSSGTSLMQIRPSRSRPETSARMAILQGPRAAAVQAALHACMLASRGVMEQIPFVYRSQGLLSPSMETACK